MNHHSMLGMYMSEKMHTRFDGIQTRKKFFGTVIYAVIKIQNAKWRCMRNQHIVSIGILA